MPNFDDLFVVLFEDDETVQVAPRAPVQGMDTEAIRQTGYRPRQFRIRNSVAYGLARYLETIRFPVDVPMSPGEAAMLPAGVVPVPQSEIKDFIPAKLWENLFWGLTSDDIFGERQYQGTLVGFLTESGTFDLRGRQGANQQMAMVKVVVESSPAQLALQGAMRVWSLFLEKVGFTLESQLVDPASGQMLKVRQPDFAVQQVKPTGEPKIVERVGAGRVKAEFDLVVHYTRFI